MASWREIDRIRKDAKGFRAIAHSLLTLSDPGFTEWEVLFLESIASDKNIKQYTARQSEKLLEIRDGGIVIDKLRGFSVTSLIARCYEARHDLAEDDEEWVTALRLRNPHTMKRRDSGHLLRCARELGLVEAHEVVS